jgi:hypothetical protein
MKLGELQVSLLSAALTVVVVGCACLVLGYWGAVQHVAPQLQRWRDSVQVEVQGREMADAALARRDAEILQYQSLVDSLAARAVPLPPERPPVPQNLPNVGTASDSAAFWEGEAMAARAASEQLQQDNAVLRQEAERRQAQLEATAHLLALADSNAGQLRAERDRLRALIDAAPQGKPRGISILGLRLCPVVGPGYAATLTDGSVRTGPTVAVLQPLTCG